MIHGTEIYNDVMCIRLLCEMASDYMMHPKPSTEDKVEAGLIVLDKIRDTAATLEKIIFPDADSEK